MTEEEYKRRRAEIHARAKRKAEEIARKYPDSSASEAAAPAIAAEVRREVAKLDAERATKT